MGVAANDMSNLARALTTGPATGQPQASMSPTSNMVRFALAKYAVRTGGGTNHRLGLDDAILIKDNHLALGGGDVAAAVRKARAAFPGLPLEVECRTLAEVSAAVGAAPDLILLDNMPAGEVAKAVEIARGRVPLEASGGVTLEQLQALARAGVDFVAVGAITHSAPAADLNLKIEPLP